MKVLLVSYNTTRISLVKFSQVSRNKIEIYFRSTIQFFSSLPSQCTCAAVLLHCYSYMQKQKQTLALHVVQRRSAELTLHADYP